MVAETKTLSRNAILARLKQDLIGPGSEHETIDELPGDRYLTGILFPRRSTIEADEDEELKGGNAGGDDGDADEADATVRLSGQIKPATMGMSFSVAGPTQEARLCIEISLATYEAHHEAGEDDDEAADQDGLVPGRAEKLHDTRWRRRPRHIRLGDARIVPGYHKLTLGDGAPAGLELHYQAVPEQDRLMVTMALVNNSEDSDDRAEREERAFFQVSMSAQGIAPTRIVQRPFRTARTDEEGKLAALIYRDIRHHSVGHTCSTRWSGEGDSLAVHTSWIPSQRVPAMNPRGGKEFAPLGQDANIRPLSASWLASAGREQLAEGLRRIPACYTKWIERQEARIGALPTALQETAIAQMQTCRGIASRIAAAAERIGREEEHDVRRCFQLANRAIALARKWSRNEDDLVWRPFQIAFVLLSLESIADPAHADREVMDLLWFPTGGGKTEAYLGLIAFLLFHRRLRQDPRQGAGTAAIMRYTLRALTIQQFQRAAGLVMACEQLRKEAKEPRFGNTCFSIGLWVGSSATPNTVKEAANRQEGASSDHRQLMECPCCHAKLTWTPNQRCDEMAVRCRSKDCAFAKAGSLPVYTIDEDIYRVLPSLLIGTIDKFAQVARKAETGRLFGIGTGNAPPDLIVQDELHLISGPLGTIAGLYETAIDHLCSKDGQRPKILGSTATIRRAADQIRSLFDRTTCQFPPPGLDHDDSGFAVVDPDAPGRLHVGVTTAGRSPKFTLQAVSASLLQSATCNKVPKVDQDSYSTLLVYFNSLRELGGALVLMQDDVHATIEAYSRRHGETGRTIEVPEELTSRKSAAEIRELLGLLDDPERSPEVLLASNMISVGVDIQRLSMMVVNGQPKTIAEYIQATSRVGRGATPGLVLSIYNNSRTRDRSHYETFPTWHEGIYRDVEATSVTPFASRAIEKAVHAAFVSLVRHLIPSMRTQPILTAETKAEAESLIEVIVGRVGRIDPGEEAAVRASLEALLEQWALRQDLDEYWVDNGDKVGLLISAEQHAARRASGAEVDAAWPTPNSMRDVEPSTLFKLGLRGD
jgi:Helicase conserved C-terminal domain